MALSLPDRCLRLTAGRQRVLLLVSERFIWCGTYHAAPDAIMGG